MNEQPLPNKLKNLESKIQALISSHHSLKEEREKLTNQNSNLLGQIETLEAKLNDFQNQDKITKIVSGSTVEKEEATELKNKLNEYIKEIDRCIAHLS